MQPSLVRVQVYNGAGVSGLGTKASGDLANRGFDVAGPAQNWRRTGLTRTVLRYDSRYTESIKTLAASLPGSKLVSVPDLGRTLQVVVGTSYGGARAVKMAGAQGPTSASGSPRTAATQPCS